MNPAKRPELPRPAKLRALLRASSSWTPPTTDIVSPTCDLIRAQLCSRSGGFTCPLTV